MAQLTADDVESILDKAFKKVFGWVPEVPKWSGEVFVTDFKVSRSKISFEQLQKCADEGMTVKEAAEICGVHVATIYAHQKRYSQLKFKKGKRGPKSKNDKNE